MGVGVDVVMDMVMVTVMDMDIDIVMEMFTFMDLDMDMDMDKIMEVDMDMDVDMSLICPRFLIVFLNSRFLTIWHIIAWVIGPEHERRSQADPKSKRRPERPPTRWRPLDF